MKKYLSVAKLTFLETTENRGKAIIWLIAGMVSPLLTIALWLSAVKSGQSAQGFSRSDFVIYYFLVFIAGQVFCPHTTDEIERKIQEGTLNSYLLRPLTLIKFTFFHEGAWKIFETVISLPFLIGFLLIFKESFYIAQNNLFLLGYSFVSFCIGYFSLFCLDTSIGMLAFWMFKTSSIRRLYDLVINFANGRYIPLVFLPVFFAQIADFLPFKYTVYFPISIIMDKINFDEILRQGILQIIWLGILVFLMILVWKKGIKKYEGVGI